MVDVRRQLLIVMDELYLMLAPLSNGLSCKHSLGGTHTTSSFSID